MVLYGTWFNPMNYNHFVSLNDRISISMTNPSFTQHDHSLGIMLFIDYHYNLPYLPYLPMIPSNIMCVKSYSAALRRRSWSKK